MKIYNIHSTQFLPISIKDAWDFFSSPRNLAKITPSKMNFEILSVTEDKRVYAGQMIQYKVTVLPGLRVKWLTEITHVSEHNHFIDEQRFGPYTMWHHQHFFKEVENGVEMTDHVTYALPLGFLGRLAHWLFVRKEIENIFEHRKETLNRLFQK
ncbi:MAG: SRPBCC family protein [Cyclobacteriaceae bacterium]